MNPQPLHVGHQIPCRVGIEAGMGKRTSAAALIEQDDSVACRVVIAAHGRVASSTRPAVNDQRRLAARVTAFLEIDLMPTSHLQALVAKGLDQWEKYEPFACRHRRCRPVAAVTLVPAVTCLHSSGRTTQVRRDITWARETSAASDAPRDRRVSRRREHASRARYRSVRVMALA